MKLIGQYKDSPSLISRDASTAIKGLLMLLIVFGHTAMLTTNFATGERTFFWYWLYSFHVYIFLILPFVYGYHRKGATDTSLEGGSKYVNIKQVINDLKHNLVKIGVPYCWFFLFSAIVFVTVGVVNLTLRGCCTHFSLGTNL